MPYQYLTHYWLMYSFYTILKALENLWLSDVFRGYRKRKSGSEDLKMLITGTKSLLLGYEVIQVLFIKTILMKLHSTHCPLKPFFFSHFHPPFHSLSRVFYFYLRTRTQL